MSQDKNKRQIEVYKAITQLRSGFVDEVFSVVAKRLGESTDNSAMKRAVRRDLNALVDSHVLNIEYYTPSGDLIPPDEEDQHKNTRAKYVVPGDFVAPIRGELSLKKNGMAVLCHDFLAASLNFTEDIASIPTGSVCLSIETATGSYVHLFVHPEDLPLRVQISRGYEYSEEFVLRQKIVNQMSRRSLIILGSNKTISRYRMGDFKSHVQLSFQAESQTLEIAKDIEDASVFYAKKWNIDTSFSLLEQTDETREIPTLRVDWNQVASPVSIELPTLIKIGAVLVIAHIKK